MPGAGERDRGAFVGLGSREVAAGEEACLAMVGRSERSGREKSEESRFAAMTMMWCRPAALLEAAAVSYAGYLSEQRNIWAAGETGADVARREQHREANERKQVRKLHTGRRERGSEVVRGERWMSGQCQARRCFRAFQW